MMRFSEQFLKWIAGFEHRATVPHWGSRIVTFLQAQFLSITFTHHFLELWRWAALLASTTLQPAARAQTIATMRVFTRASISTRNQYVGRYVSVCKAPCYHSMGYVGGSTLLDVHLRLPVPTSA
jgi:hypothetical protein